MKEGGNNMNQDSESFRDILYIGATIVTLVVLVVSIAIDVFLDRRKKGKLK